MKSAGEELRGESRAPVRRRGRRGDLRGEVFHVARWQMLVILPGHKSQGSRREGVMAERSQRQAEGKERLAS
jgi:hypothetical protein